MSKNRWLTGLLAAMAWSVIGEARASVVTDWNAITLVCVQGAPPTIPANRGGPPGLLDIALIQAAVHDAVQAVEGRFESYRYENPTLLGNGSPEVAAAAATYTMLVALYGTSDPCLVGVTDPAVTYAGDAGLQAGMEAAAALLPFYRPTMVLPTDPFLGGMAPGEWRPTPGVTQGANTFMAVTTPFALSRPSQFRPPPPPPLTSGTYRRDYDEVKEFGALDSPSRSVDQTDMARFWTSNFIAQWFAVTRQVADANLAEQGDHARLLALVAFAAADSQIAVYETKYRENFWRPITAIWEGDNDGNAKTEGDPGWTSMIAAPPYPDYTSGANCITGAVTTILRLYFGTDEIAFSVSSTASPLMTNPRHFERFSDAAREVVEARILQGIHFRFADEEGRRQGSRVAHWTFAGYLRPLTSR